jgi:hypothetical protein
VPIASPATGAIEVTARAEEERLVVAVARITAVLEEAVGVVVEQEEDSRIRDLDLEANAENRLERTEVGNDGVKKPLA